MKRIIRPFILSIFCLSSLSISALAQSDELSTIQLTNVLSSTGTTIRGASYDGKRIVFESKIDYTGENADGNNEIFVFDGDSGKFIQITKTADIKDPADATKTLLNVSNTSPVISGDGNHIVFTSNAKLTDAANDDGNQEIYMATLPRNTFAATFLRITNTDKNTDTEVVKEIFNNYSPTVNADGTSIAFLSTRRVFKALENGTPEFSVSLEGPNRDQPADGNAELFLYNVTAKRYTQVTISRDVDATSGFQVKGFNGVPHLSGNGQVLAFVSGFNYPGANAGNNADFNGEIFLYRVGDPANSFRQLTNTTGNSAVPDMGAMNLLPAFTRPLNFAGTLIVFESAGDFAGRNTDKTREIFLADLAGAQPSFRQITDQTTADLATSDFNFLPSINGAGTVITFSSILNLVPTDPHDLKTDNGDLSRELFLYDIAASTPTTPKLRQLTFTPPAAFLLDQRQNTAFSFANDTGNLFTFNYVGFLIATNLSSTTEIFQERLLPVTTNNPQAATLANAASFDSTQLSRGSIAAAFGTMLSNSIAGTTSANLPFEIGGVRVTIGGLAAGLLFVSPGQVNFVIPEGIAEGDAVPFSINNNGVRSSGTVKIVPAAPGVFAVSSDGTGTAAAICGAVVDVEGGVAQVETATVIGTITAAGNVTVIVTAAGLSGSPITTQVAVANGDTASQVAEKIKTALGSNTSITTLFTVSGSGADVTLTRNPPFAANDETLNISIANGTSTGLTAAPTSANVTMGITSQQFVTSSQPCDVGTPERASFLIIFGTGWRLQGNTTTVTVGGETLVPTFAGAQPNFPGLDQINVPLTQTLMGKGLVDLIVTSNSIASKTVQVAIK